MIVEVKGNTGRNGVFTDVLFYTIEEIENERPTLTVAFANHEGPAQLIKIDNPNVVQVFGKN